MTTTELVIDTGDETVSGLLDMPSDASAVYVLAHGAGAGMRHSFMAAITQVLTMQGIGVLRYQFPYMEAGSRRPDRPPRAHATVRAATATAAKHAPGLPLIAGGKSFGGRMTSQAQALDAMPEVVGLAFLGFPLHPSGRPGVDRADHLFDVSMPMLFLQGTRDTLAEVSLLEPLCRDLGDRARLELVEGGDHSFKVPKKSGLSPDDVMDDLAARFVAWVRDLA